MHHVDEHAPAHFEGLLEQIETQVQLQPTSRINVHLPMGPRVRGAMPSRLENVFCRHEPSPFARPVPLREPPGFLSRSTPSCRY